MRSLAVFVFAFALSLSAQTSNTGTVVGAVTDPSSGIVPGATVQLEDTVTKVVRSSEVNSSGRYAFVGVAPGTYSLRATAQGFQEAVVSKVQVEVSKSYTIDLQ